MNFEVEINEYFKLEEYEILYQLKKYPVYDIIEFRNDINDIIEEKGGKVPERFQFRNEYEDTMDNTQKINLLFDNISDISIEDLEKIIKK